MASASSTVTSMPGTSKLPASRKVALSSEAIRSGVVNSLQATSGLRPVDVVPRGR